MAKDFLAFLGLVFLTLLILAGVALIGYLYHTYEFITLPDELLAWIGPVAVSPAERPPAEKVEWVNPLDALPTATLPPLKTNTPVPSLTPSPIPALDPAVYRSEVTSRLKQFVVALEEWRDLNNELVNESRLASDPAWLEEMTISLEVVVMTGSGLAGIGPPPEEYAGVAAWLERLPPEVAGLKRSYLEALSTGETEAYLVAGDHFARIKEALAGAVEQMLALGWSIE
jgi:hypothetical protein